MSKYAPFKFEKVEEFVKKTNAYFALCKKEKHLPNKAGWVLHLKINRDTISDYRHNRLEFTNAIKDAETYIEQAWIGRLEQPSCVGAIFYLKNAFREDYRDRYDTDITSGGKPLPLLDYVSWNNNGNKQDKAVV